VTSNTGLTDEPKDGKKPEPKPDSITGVNPTRTHGLGIWGNPRVVFGVRVDSELKKSFISVSKRVFGSTCVAVESYMATIVGCIEEAEKLRVNPSKTVNIEIGEIKIERNLRERRKLVAEEINSVAAVAPERKCDFCGKVPVVGVFRHVCSGMEKHACGYHASILKTHEKWEIIDHSNPKPSQKS